MGIRNCQSGSLYSHMLSSHLFIFSVLFIQNIGFHLIGSRHDHPANRETLFLSSFKSGTFLSCSELSSHRCPDVPFLHPSPHLFCTLALN